jgi:hypothetical protein
MRGNRTCCISILVRAFQSDIVFKVRTTLKGKFSEKIEDILRIVTVIHQNNSIYSI